jgi:hypothetical protein
MRVLLEIGATLDCVGERPSGEALVVEAARRIEKALAKE